MANEIMKHAWQHSHAEMTSVIIQTMEKVAFLTGELEQAKQREADINDKMNTLTTDVNALKELVDSEKAQTILIRAGLETLQQHHLNAAAQPVVAQPVQRQRIQPQTRVGLDETDCGAAAI